MRRAAVILVAVAFGVAGSAQAAIEWRRASLHRVVDPGSRDYGYAAALLVDRGGAWLWSCENERPRVVRDVIVARRLRDGRPGRERVALRGSDGRWDAVHVCDPSVVRGRFRLGRTLFRYAMAYLGTDRDVAAHNQVGVALARTPRGPWTKLRSPVVPFENRDQWGVGQASLVAIRPRLGRLQLFYTRGDTDTLGVMRTLDLSDARRPRLGPETTITRAGLSGHDGNQDWLNGFDVALDAQRRRLWVVREQHPYPPDPPSWIGQSVQVASIRAMRSALASGRWRVEGDIAPPLTGLARNHNAGFVRTARGTLPDPDRITVVFSSSCAGEGCDPLWSYDLWSIRGRVR
jgi:hypothetical protein